MPKPKVAISDSSGNEVAVSSNALDVNIAGGASIDIGDVEVKGHSTIGHGINSNISDSTAEVLGSSQDCKHIDIMASPNNTGFIFVGGSGVGEGAAEGVQLYAGDVYSIDIDNVDKVFVLASVDGEDVSWTYFN